MTRALFEVGERVKLVSKDFPERNGEYTVRQVISKGESFICRLTGKTITKGDTGYTYLLEETCEFGAYAHETAWREKALRKIYPPSKYSFEELLSELKQGKMDNIEA
jgi:hypothetical protein